jgi:hypothetical protein
MGGVETQRPLEEADAGRGPLVGEQLDIREPGGVVDADVHEFPAGDAVAARIGEAVAAVAGHPMAAPQDAAELLDADVDQLAGPLALVSVGRLERLQPAELAEPDPGSGSPARSRAPCPSTPRSPGRSSAHGAAPRSPRSPRRDPPRWRRAGSSAPRGGPPEPSSPSARKRPTHFEAIRSLTSAAPAASASDQSSSTTRLTSLSRCFGARAALPWSIIRRPPWDWVALTLPASKEARMNNVVRFYT